MIIRGGSESMEKDLTNFIHIAKQFGAYEAKIIHTSSIHIAGWVRMKCQYGCDGFHSNLCCPPFTPTPHETRKIIDDYQKALLIHCQPGTHVTEISIKLEREIFLSGFHKAFGFGAGPCENALNVI